MSVANYLASVFDHSRILVCVKFSPDLNKESRAFVLGVLDRHKRLVINDAGCCINVNFEVDSWPKNSEWGSFQAHRQVFGLIFVANASTPMEAALVQDKFNKIKEEYRPGLYHSRCLIFGIDTTIRQSHNQDIFQFSSHEAWKSADYDLKQLITSIFYDLESKRLKMGQEKNGKPPLIVAPFEASDPEGDADSKTHRKKCLGRHNKHLGDVSLLSGQLAEALLCYHTALDILISTNDTMWIGSALEGLCVVSSQVLFPDLNPENKLWVKEKAQKQVLDPRNLVSKQSSAPTLAELQKLSIPSIEDLVDRYKEAIIYYSRCKSLGIIEMEACIKATKVLTRAKKSLEASEFLQNAVYITLNLPDAERVKRYGILADLYEGIGFRRKGAFYKRVAAMQCVAPQLKEPDWGLCNTLLLSSLPGYDLDMKTPQDDMDKPCMTGWPNVRLRVIRELVFSSDKIGNQPLAHRYMMFLLLEMLPDLTETEEKDVCSALENYAKMESRLVVENESPHLDMRSLPVMKSIRPQSLAEEAKPHKVNMKNPKSESVFIYTPSSYQSNTDEKQKMNFTWCANAACIINITLYNPLRYSPLQVSNFSLLTDVSSTVLHSQEVSLSIPPNSEKKVPLIVTPLNPGTVKIIGYTLCVFGVTSKCFFENIENLPSEINIEVINELPLLKCSHEIKEQDGNTSSPVVKVFPGEKYNVPFLLSNVGQCPVQHIKILPKEKPDARHISIVFNDCQDDLPLLPNATLLLPISVEPKPDCAFGRLSSCSFSIQYAGSSKEDVWWRTVDLEFQVTVEVCVVVDSFKIEKDEDDSSIAILSMKIHNHLAELIQLSYLCMLSGERKRTSIRGKSVDNLSIRFKKVCMSKLEQGHDKGIEHSCILYLKNMLGMEWRILSEHVNDERSGNVRINNVLTRESVCSMLKSPVSLELLLDDATTCDYQTITAVVGETYNLCFEFKNRTQWEVDLEAQLEVFQDQKNGYIEWNMEKCVLCIGSRTANLHLRDSACEVFKCILLFLRSGKYSVRSTYKVNLLNHNVFKLSSPPNTVTYQSHVITVDTKGI